MASKVWNDHLSTGAKVIGTKPILRSRNNGIADNDVDRFEAFVLGDDEKKVTQTPETRVPNASVFLFKKEDHTLGNLLQKQLLKNNSVKFAAYKIPHPLTPDFELRVQTDGTIAPKEAVILACQEVVQDLDKLSREFTKEMELKKIANTGREG